MMKVKGNASTTPTSFLPLVRLADHCIEHYRMGKAIDPAVVRQAVLEKGEDVYQTFELLSVQSSPTAAGGGGGGGHPLNGVSGDRTPCCSLETTILHYLLQYGTVACVEVLLSKPRRKSLAIDFNAEDSKGIPALHAICARIMDRPQKEEDDEQDNEEERATVVLFRRVVEYMCQYGQDRHGFRIRARSDTEGCVEMAFLNCAAAHGRLSVFWPVLKDLVPLVRKQLNSSTRFMLEGSVQAVDVFRLPTKDREEHFLFCGDILGVQRSTTQLPALLMAAFSYPETNTTSTSTATNTVAAAAETMKKKKKSKKVEENEREEALSATAAVSDAATTAVRECVAGYADVCADWPGAGEPMLARVLREGSLACVAACLDTPLPIVWENGIIEAACQRHCTYTMKQVFQLIRERLLRRGVLHRAAADVVERAAGVGVPRGPGRRRGRSESHNVRGTGWEKMEEWDWDSCFRWAAFWGVLSVVWPVMEDLVHTEFLHRQREHQRSLPFRLTVSWEFDWEQMATVNPGVPPLHVPILGQMNPVPFYTTVFSRYTRPYSMLQENANTAALLRYTCSPLSTTLDASVVQRYVEGYNYTNNLMSNEAGTTIPSFTASAPANLNFVLDQETILERLMKRAAFSDTAVKLATSMAAASSPSSSSLPAAEANITEANNGMAEEREEDSDFLRPIAAALQSPAFILWTTADRCPMRSSASSSLAMKWRASGSGSGYTLEADADRFYSICNAYVSFDRRMRQDDVGMIFGGDQMAAFRGGIVQTTAGGVPCHGAGARLSRAIRPTDGTSLARVLLCFGEAEAMLRPTLRLVLDRLRRCPDEARSLDWSSLLQSAASYGVLSVLFDELRQSDGVQYILPPVNRGGGAVGMAVVLHRVWAYDWENLIRLPPLGLPPPHQDKNESEEEVNPSNSNNKKMKGKKKAQGEAAPVRLSYLPPPTTVFYRSRGAEGMCDNSANTAALLRVCREIRCRQVRPSSRFGKADPASSTPTTTMPAAEDGEQAADNAVENVVNIAPDRDHPDRGAVGRMQILPDEEANEEYGGPSATLDQEKEQDDTEKEAAAAATSADVGTAASVVDALDIIASAYIFRDVQAAAAAAAEAEEGRRETDEGHESCELSLLRLREAAVRFYCEEAGETILLTLVRCGRVRLIDTVLRGAAALEKRPEKRIISSIGGGATTMSMGGDGRCPSSAFAFASSANTNILSFFVALEQWYESSFWSLSGSPSGRLSSASPSPVLTKWHPHPQYSTLRQMLHMAVEALPDTAMCSTPVGSSLLHQEKEVVEAGRTIFQQATAEEIPTPRGWLVARYFMTSPASLERVCEIYTQCKMLAFLWRKLKPLLLLQVGSGSYVLPLSNHPTKSRATNSDGSADVEEDGVDRLDWHSRAIHIRSTVSLEDAKRLPLEELYHSGDAGDNDDDGGSLVHHGTRHPPLSPLFSLHFDGGVEYDAKCTAKLESLLLADRKAVRTKSTRLVEIMADKEDRVRECVRGFANINASFHLPSIAVNDGRMPTMEDSAFTLLLREGSVGSVKACLETLAGVTFHTRQWNAICQRQDPDSVTPVMRLVRQRVEQWRRSDTLGGLATLLPTAACFGVLAAVWRAIEPSTPSHSFCFLDALEKAVSQDFQPPVVFWAHDVNQLLGSHGHGWTPSGGSPSSTSSSANAAPPLPQQQWPASISQLPHSLWFDGLKRNATLAERVTYAEEGHHATNTHHNNVNNSSELDYTQAFSFPTSLLLRVASAPEPDARVVSACVAAGANLSFRPTPAQGLGVFQELTILHLLVRSGVVAAVEAALHNTTTAVVDFTLTGGVGNETVLHCLCRLPQVKIAVAILDVIVNRLQSHPTDVVDFSVLNRDGFDFLTEAARRKRLAPFWSKVKDFPYYADNTAGIHLRYGVFRKDWDQVEDEDKTCFLAPRIL